MSFLIAAFCFLGAVYCLVVFAVLFGAAIHEFKNGCSRSGRNVLILSSIHGIAFVGLLVIIGQLARI